MTIARALTILFLLAALLGSARAEVDPVRTPFAWKVSGDSLKDFKAEFVAHRKPDRSTPKTLVETYAAYTDNRYAMGDEFDRVNRLWLAVVHKSLEAEQALLFDEAAHKTLKAANDARLQTPPADGFERVMPMEVTDQSDGPAGTTYVEAMQNFEVAYQHPDGGTRTHERREHWRFTCVRGGDEKWLIRRVEIWKLDLNKSTPETPVYMWDELETLLDVFYFTRADVAQARKAEVPAIDTSTPERAALSVLNSLAPTRQRRTDMVLEKGLEGWIRAVEGLFTDVAQAAAEARAARKVAKSLPAEKQAWALDVQDGNEGAKVVRVVSGAVFGMPSRGAEFHVVKGEAGWRITACGSFTAEKDEAGKPALRFTAEPDVYALAAKLAR